MRLPVRLVSLLVPAALLLACAGEEQATAAFNETEEVMTEQHAEAIRYAPDEFRAVMAAYDSAKTHFYAEDYGAAVKSAKKTTEMARQLSTAITAGREVAEEQWGMVSEDVASTLKTFETELDQLVKSRRLPQGVKRADVNVAQEELTKLKRAMEEGGKEFDRGNIAEALHIGSQVNAQARQLMEQLNLMPQGGGTE